MRLVDLFLPFSGILGSKRPNVVIILADDLGIGDLQIYNKESLIPTPNIDKLGREGFRFKDAHAGSSRCGPSRYALMTGRYSLEPHKNRKLLPGTPHLGELFKNAGYTTGIVGKHQPLDSIYVLEGQTAEELNAQRKAKKEYTKKNWSPTGRETHQHKYSFFQPGNYSLERGPHTASYDYSFLIRSPCCTPGGGYFENGVGISPFDTWAIQRAFPEHMTKADRSFIDLHTGKRKEKTLVNSYVGAPYFSERTEGPVMTGNYPPSILVQEGYDTRYAEQRTNKKAMEFIDRAAKDQDPFFLYYGMRAAHKPFNSPLEYRNVSNVGQVGDNIMELDDNVGNIMKKLEETGLSDDTIVIFLSDNGADPFFRTVYSMYGHYQNALNYKDVNYRLKGGKESLHEGGHRLPMIWRWPNGIKSGINTRATVSYIDVFATLADILDVDLQCNQAPDSRSLIPLFEDTKGFPMRPIIHHGLTDASHAIRHGKWKLINSDPPRLYNLDEDLVEEFDLADKHPGVVEFLKKELNDMLQNIFHREKITEFGKLEIC